MLCAIITFTFDRFIYNLFSTCGFFLPCRIQKICYLMALTIYILKNSFPKDNFLLPFAFFWIFHLNLDRFLNRYLETYMFSSILKRGSEQNKNKNITKNNEKNKEYHMFLKLYVNKNIFEQDLQYQFLCLDCFLFNKLIVFHLCVHICCHFRLSLQLWACLFHSRLWNLWKVSSCILRPTHSASWHKTRTW